MDTAPHSAGFVIPRERMRFVWVSNHWDYHLSGLCRVNGALCRFEAISHKRYRVFALPPAERLRWLVRKLLFEACVGRHWTYPDRVNGARFRVRRPAWLWNAVLNAYYHQYRKLTTNANP